MAAKHASISDRSDSERLRKENAVLHEELSIVREEMEGERRTHGKLLESFQASHKEDSRKLREEKKLTDNLAEENAQLRAELKLLRDRYSGQNGNSVGAQILKDMSSFGRRFDALQSDMMSSCLMRNIQGKHGINQVDVDLLKEDFKRINSELVSLGAMLTGTKGDLAPNGMLLMSAVRQGSKTRGISSNSVTGNNTSCPNDLVHLAGPTTENGISQMLQHRATAGNGITKMGPVLVSVNSFDTYTQATLQASHDTQCLHSAVNQVIGRMVETGLPQVFVLSGCSGSGKSFLSHLLIRQVLEQAVGALDTDVSKFIKSLFDGMLFGFQQHFLASFTVLQSLGNAKTLTNSNSSRVGQLLEFHFSDGLVNKTKIQCYPLDNTRVVIPLPGERNYHIFYQLLSGITQEERAKLHLQGYSVHNLHYLNKSTLPSEDEDVVFRAKFERWRTGLGILGIPFTDVLRILVAILLLGNVQFVEGEGLELDVKGNNEIKAVAALLGVSGVSLYRGLTTRTNNLRGQMFRSLCEPAVANHNRDCVAMALYSRTLAAVVRRINSFKRPPSSTLLSSSPQGSSESIRSPPASPGSSGEIGKTLFNNYSNGGLLTTPQPASSVWSSTNGTHASSRGASGLVAVMDMFGFESSKVNQLEQICVNLCSETIQHFYNTHIFKGTEEYCREEGIQCDLDIDYVDNAPCIELLTCQRAGILTMLDKESLFARGTYQGLLQKVRTQHQESECFFDPDPEGSCFAVCHFADNVVYDAKSLLVRNRDSIPDDIVCVFSRQNCNFGFATHLFTSDFKTHQGQTAAPKGVTHRISPTLDQNSSPSTFDSVQSTFSQDFQSKLDGLLKTLVQAQPLFIRCIKANSREDPNVFDRDVVSQQLRVLQVFETLQLLQSGFAHHSRFQAFAQKYGFLSSSRVVGVKETGLEDCKAILEAQLRTADKTTAEMLFGSWILGKKYVFYSEAMKQHLDVQFDERKVSAAVTIQAWVRKWVYQKRWPGLKRSLEMQRKARSHSRTNHKHVRSRSPTVSPKVPTDRELRVDTKTAEQTCCLYGLDMETPPPVPKSRLYTVMGNMKMGFPQTRIMKTDFPGVDGELLLRKGEAVKVVSASRKRGYLIVEHRNGTNLQVPFQLTELKSSPHSSPR